MAGDAALPPVQCLVTGHDAAGRAVIRVVDMLPGCLSPMHRSNSIDYGIVLTNEVELELDSGEKRTVTAGGVIVQRCTNQRCRSRTDRPTRLTSSTSCRLRAAPPAGTRAGRDISRPAPRRCRRRGRARRPGCSKPSAK